MHRPRSRLGQAGISLIESVVALAIISGVIYTWVSLTVVTNKEQRKGLQNYQLVMERQAMTAMVQTIPRSIAVQALCSIEVTDPPGSPPQPLPHPFGTVDSSGNCTPTQSLAAIQDAFPAWRELSVAILSWPTQSKVDADEAHPDAALSQAYFNSTIVPKMSAAGCLYCHGSDKNYTLDASWTSKAYDATQMAAVPDMYARDFNRYQHIVNPISVGGVPGNLLQPLASRAILASRLGQTMLTSKITLPGMLANSSNIETIVEFTKSSVPLTLTSYARSARSKQTTCAAVEASKATACNAGETYIADSCKQMCIKQQPPKWCDCGKGCGIQLCQPEPCELFRADYACKSNVVQSPLTIPDIPGNLYGADAEAVAERVNDPLPDTVCITNAGQQTPKMCTSLKENKGQITICDSTHPNRNPCYVAGSCRHTCTTTRVDPGGSCGKDCVNQPRVTGCDIQELRFDCKRVLDNSTITTDFVNFTVTTREVFANGIDPITGVARKPSIMMDTGTLP